MTFVGSSGGTRANYIWLSGVGTFPHVRWVGGVVFLRLNIQLPKTLKSKLDAERRRGTSAAGLIRHLLEQHFRGKQAA